MYLFLYDRIVHSPHNTGSSHWLCAQPWPRPTCSSVWRPHAHVKNKPRQEQNTKPKYSWYRRHYTANTTPCLCSCLGLMKMWKLILILWLKALSMQLSVDWAVFERDYFLPSPEEKEDRLRPPSCERSLTVRRCRRVLLPTETAEDEDSSCCLQVLISSTITCRSEGGAMT